MPFIVHVLADDLAGWELENRTARFFHYRPRGMSTEFAEQIQIVSPAALESLVEKDLVGFINVEKGWMSKKIGAHPETKIQLKMPKEGIQSQHRLRLKIREVDGSTRPPRVMLEEWKEGL